MKLLITGGSGFIGSNFIELLLANKIDNFINVDKQKPLNSKHDAFWVNCNIMDKEGLSKIFSEFKPTHVLHLAARTDTSSNKLEDYDENTEGTENLIRIIENTNSIKLVIITSTQYVYKSKEHPLPKTDEDFIPHTAYGISKKITEDMTRNSTMNTAWTIVRPTNVWGPWNLRYPEQLLKIIDMGLYLHPGSSNPIKSFAYVKNVAHQIWGIIQSPIADVNKKIYYVGDYPMGSLQWINAFSNIIKGKPVQSFPIFLLQMVSWGGDILKRLKVPFPLHSERFNNMMDDYDTPMKKTIDLFGLSHPDLKENVTETMNWIKDERHRFKYWKNK